MARRIESARVNLSTQTGVSARRVAAILGVAATPPSERTRVNMNEGVPMSDIPASEMVFCRACGKQMHVTALACPQCGAQQRPVAAVPRFDPNASPKLLLPAVLLCFWFGVFGVHRFFVGKVGTGLLQLFTFGGLGIWALIDLIILVCGSFTDSEGRKLTQWT